MSKENITELYREIKLSHDGKKLYNERYLKLNQLIDYKKQVDSVIKRISKKRVIHLVESCAGNCFLSFYLAWHYREEFGNSIKFTCIERNSRLIEEARITAKKLNLTNMEFIVSNVEDIDFKENIDVVYSLHACDLATDYTIALGLKHKARYILSVSCCQHTFYKKIRKHPLKGLTQHSVYKEQLTAMAGDSIRAELVKSYGYKADIFAFTSVKNSGKNIMLKAKLDQVSQKKRIEALVNYNALTNLFNAEPELLNILPTFPDTLQHPLL